MFLCMDMALPASALAIENDINLAAKIPAVIKDLRTTPEETANTTEYFPQFSGDIFRSFSYPVTWIFTTNEKNPSNTTQMYFSQKFYQSLLKKAGYRNNLTQITIPVAGYSTKILFPDTSDNSIFDTQTISFAPLLASSDLSGVDGMTKISFASSKPTAKVFEVSPTFTTTLEEKEKTMLVLVRSLLGSFTLNPKRPLVPVVEDTTLFGLKARRMTFTFDGGINRTTMRLKYQTTFAIRDGSSISADIIALESDFASAQTTLNSMVKSVKLKDIATRPLEQISSSAAAKLRTDFTIDLLQNGKKVPVKNRTSFTAKKDAFQFQISAPAKTVIAVNVIEVPSGTSPANIPFAAFSVSPQKKSQYATLSAKNWYLPSEKKGRDTESMVQANMQRSRSVTYDLSGLINEKGVMWTMGKYPLNDLLFTFAALPIDDKSIIKPNAVPLYSSALVHFGK